MSVRLSRSTTLLTLASFLVAVAPHVMAMPPVLWGFIVAAIGWRAGAELGNWRPPGRWIRVGATFLGLGLVILHYGTLWGRRAATALLCVMVASKLLEMYRLRDARTVAALAFFLVATQFLFSQKLELMAWLLAACWLATVALLRIQRDEDAPRSTGTSSGPSVLAMLRSGAIQMAFAIPFALILFTLFPRLGSPLWGLPEEALDGRTGLSDEMSVGNIANLFNDDSPAFRVTFEGPPPGREELYWRGPVLWNFDGRTWSRVFYANRPVERVPEPDADSFRYTVQIEPTERRWLFALDYAASWPENVRVSSNFELVNDEPLTSLTPYEVISEPDFIDTPELTPLFRRLATELPDGSNPRTRARALELREQYTDDVELIESVLRWFNEGPFFYSLETAPLGRHGADEFLFDLRTGYCEYYASAFAVLMRHAGIPTRVVTGYQGGFWQSADEYLLVRNSDAHAWVEVWLDGRGWTRIDPTAAVSPSRILDGARSALPNATGWFDADWIYGLRNQYDRLQNLWNQWVLGFDADRQKSMLRQLGLQALGVTGQAALMIAAILLLGPLAWWIFGRASVDRRSRDPLLRAWERLERRLRRRNAGRSPEETLQEWLPRASASIVNGDELERLAAEYSRYRYGPPGNESARLRFLERCRRWRPRTD
jgi:transglutaminase-like putative cysteine protease